MVKDLPNVFQITKFKEEGSLVFLIRLAFFALFFIIFQAVIIIQKPFMHTEFMYAFYITMAVIFLNYGIHYVIQKYESPLHYSLDIFCIYYLFNNQPQYASYYLIYIVLILFFAGLQLPIKQSILLGFLASFLLSAVNLMTTKWSGAQNLLT